MALINCPECGKKNVSDSAQACPECGFGVKEYFLELERKRTNEACVEKTNNESQKYELNFKTHTDEYQCESEKESIARPI